MEKATEPTKINQPDYTHYVLLHDSFIESGWSYREDARDQLKENLPPEWNTAARVVSHKQLTLLGILPDFNENWVGSDSWRVFRQGEI